MSDLHLECACPPRRSRESSYDLEEQGEGCSFHEKTVMGVADDLTLLS